MAIGLLTWLIPVIVLVLILLYLILTYNRFITLRTRIENAWAQIDVQLKRRYDLIPNLVNAVKGYMKHEKGTLEAITKARAMLVTGTMADKAKADGEVSKALKSLFAVAESYPTLKANENFMQLQEELSGTESKIAYARQFYNDSALEFNAKLQKFPSNIIANMFNFTQKEFFKAEGAEREAVKVEF
jgi:LemA protein